MRTLVVLALGVLLSVPAIALAGDPLNGSWDQFAPPTPRYGHVGVYDPVRDRVIVFGGRDGTYRNDLWSIELGTTASWKSLRAVGTPPASRLLHSAIYDPVGDRIIVFGGYSGTSTVNDLWALNLAGAPTWTVLAPAGTPPPARESHTAVYDPSRHRMIIFGGHSGIMRLNDVHVLDLAGDGAWSPLAPAGTPPPPVDAPSAIYDPVRDRMIVFGGYDDTPLNDTWSLSFDSTPTWSTLSPGGTLPGARSDHTAVYDPVHDRMVIFAGLGSPHRNDAWALSLGDGMAWSDLGPAGTPPTGRVNPSAVYDPVRQRMVACGGYDGSNFLNDVATLALDGAPAWSVLVPAAPAPSPRNGSSAVFDPVRNRLLVFGGIGSGGELGDVWALDVTAQPAWTQLAPAGTPPLGRFNHAAIYDPSRDRMVVFGGLYGTTRLSETWQLDLATTTWSMLSPAGTLPPGRSSCSAIYDAPRDRLIVFGGYDGSVRRNDTWSLSFAGTPTWSAVTPSGPLPSIRYFHSAVADVPRNRMVIYGGADGAAIRGDTWSLNLDGVPAWTSIVPAGTLPNARYGHQAIYDPVRERMVAFGGWGGGYRNDTWSLDLAGAPAWSALAPEGSLPAGRYVHAAAYDPRSDRLLVFGGDNGFTRTNDACQLIWSSLVAVDPLPAAARFELASPSPNPFRTGTRCTFVLPQAARVTLAVFDVAGRRVRGLVEESLPAGPHTVEWDRRDERGAQVRPGIYFLRLDAPGASLVEKVVTF